MWSPSASSGAWANLMTNTLCERLDSRLSWVLAILLFFCPRKNESEILSIWYSDKNKSLKNHHWTKSHLSVTKKDQNQRMNERKKERKKTKTDQRETIFNSPFQKTSKASSVDFTSTSVQPATYMLWFWSSRRILDWGGLEKKNEFKNYVHTPTLKCNVKLQRQLLVVSVD